MNLREAIDLLADPVTEPPEYERSVRVVRARLAAVGLLRACVLCGEDHTPATPIRSTPQTILVTAPAHPAFRRVLARGAWTCTPCYDATVSL